MPESLPRLRLPYIMRRVCAYAHCQCELNIWSRQTAVPPLFHKRSKELRLVSDQDAPERVNHPIVCSIRRVTPFPCCGEPESPPSGLYRSEQLAASTDCCPCARSSNAVESICAKGVRNRTCKNQSLQELNDLMIAHGHRHACAFASLTESLELSLVHLSPIDLGLLLDELAKARLRRVERVNLRCRSRRKHQWTTAYIRTCFSCLFNDLIHCAVLLSGWCARHVDRGQELRRMLQVERELER